VKEHCILIQGVRKRFGEVEVLAGVDATLGQGRITAFVGPNGAGKTTLFNAITGELPLDSGRVIYAGDDIGGLPPWKIAQLGIGKVFQDVRVFPNMSVIDNVAAAFLQTDNLWLAKSLLRGDKSVNEARLKARQLIQDIGVDGRIDGPAGELSWGNQKLLAFARVMAGGFRLVLLDEPTAGVSPTTVDRLKTLILRMTREMGMTVGLIEHNMNFVTDLADSVVVLREGRVFDQGETKEVMCKPTNFDLFCGL
jgi:ABC-type branched-subunit amino acid transport system ATPase component